MRNPGAGVPNARIERCPYYETDIRDCEQRRQQHGCFRFDKERLYATKLATTGGFLKAGNTTFICGVDDEKVDRVIDIIAKQSSRRTQLVPSATTMDVGMYTSFPVEVTVGGATIFVLNVDRFEKV